MATVTIGRSYFEALLRRAEFHTSLQDIDFGPNLFSNVTISTAEHEYLLQAEREYSLLKSALFRGGLTNDTLETLLEGENEATADEAVEYDFHTEKTLAHARDVSTGPSASNLKGSSPISDETAVNSDLRHNVRLQTNITRVASYGQTDSSIDSPPKDDEDQANPQRTPVHDQRTVLVTNLSERTTHKDLTSVIRGGRLLDIFIRSDRSATISFVEGAADFLAYAKRNDIYLHTKRLEFRMADRNRQFHVPGHVSNKIAGGATRNLVVRGAAGKITADQMRDHLDHIHNLVVVSINFKRHDAYISTNSVHNALFARTCMMSRTVYKGLRIEFYPDECAAPIPHPAMKARIHTPPTPLKTKPISNAYALLDTGSNIDSDSEDESCMTQGIRVDNHTWAHATAA